MGYDFEFDVPLGAKVGEVLYDMWKRKSQFPCDNFSCYFNGKLLTTRDCDTEKKCYSRWIDRWLELWKVDEDGD
jgi:hypothetical protein